MKIAIDLRPLQVGHQNRGIGAYLLNILDGFPRDDSLEYVFLRFDTSNPIEKFNIGKGRIYTDVTLKKFDFSPKPVEALKFFYGLIQPKFLPLLRHRPDVFFQTDYLLGVPGWYIARRRVTTCYDVIPMRFKAIYLPSWSHFASLRNLRFRSRLRQSVRALYYQNKYRKGIRNLKKSSRILSISETTTSDLINLIGINKKKIRTIYLAPSYRGKNPYDTDIIKEKDNYLLYIGGGDRRRQVQHLVSAFNKLNGRGIKIDLVLAGNEFGEDSKEMRDDIRRVIYSSSYRPQIKLLGAVSESEKLDLMQRCKIFVYPSLFEGFGLPIIEAMSAGAPVISYDNSSIREIGKEYIDYAQESSDGIYDAIISMLAMDSNVLTEKLYKARQYSLHFSWDKTTRKTITELTGAEFRERTSPE